MISIVLMLIFMLSLCYFIVYMYLNPELVDGSSIAIILLIILLIGMSFLIKSTIKEVLSLSKKGYIKAEYGKIRNKNDYTNNLMRNIPVYFNEKSCYIPNVKCDSITYQNLNIDDDVLVVSFDNKIAYCINYKGYKINYKNIKAKQLDCVEISSANKNDIKMHAKKKIFKQLILIGIMLIVLLNFSIYKNIIMLVFYSVFLIIMYKQILKLFYLYRASVCGVYKKAEYGIVIDKTFRIVKDENDFTNHMYTVNVKFPNKSSDNVTYISNIHCEMSIYDKLKVGSKVLVVSIDNNDLIVLIPNE